MIDVNNGVFHLTDGGFSYAFYVRDGKLVHAHYGRALGIPAERLAKSCITAERDMRGADWALCEAGERGRGDFRIPSVAVCGDGFASTDFAYASHEIISKPDLGMPAIRGAEETLKVTLFDAVAKLKLFLYYTVYDGALVRHAEIENVGGSTVTLLTADSLCAELESGDYEYISTDGGWGRECAVHRSEVMPGIFTLSSTRGLTSHQHNPFAAIVRRGCHENDGEAYGFSLVYSGNFAIRIERDEKDQVRVCAGIDLAGGVPLVPGERFVTPEAVSVYSHRGLGGMSAIFHRLYREHLIDGRFADKPRPIVANSWESMYFDFDEGKLLRFIRGAKGLGIDTVVLDDGWFGRRDRDDSSLGDWEIDGRKLPRGLQPIVDCCKQCGMKLGIWFEPEAVSPNSELYRSHPDWAIHTQGRESVQMRNQLMLDFSRAEVVDHIFEAMRRVLSSYDISYVKWDANRHIADIPDVAKYIGCVKGMYSLYERLTKAFPSVLIEGCASGGGRFDPAMLYYSPMIWASDDTDAYERAKIQYGLSLCYPLQALSNHVSACPNHQTGRITPFFSRGAVASLGCLGYELNVADLDAEQKADIERQTADYRKNAKLILTGELHRLISPFDGGAFCEEVVSRDKKHAYVVYMRGLNVPNMPLRKIRLEGLDPNARYFVAERDCDMSGAELMYSGIRPRADGDFGAEILHISMCEKRSTR